MNFQIDQFKSAFENEQEYGKEKSAKIRELEAQNKTLLSEMEKVKHVAENLEAFTSDKDNLLEELESKNKNIEHLKQEIAQLNEKISTKETEKDSELEKTIAQLEIDNSSKSDQIEKLHLR